MSPALQLRKTRSLPGGWHNWALGLLCLVVVAIAITSIGSSSSGASSEPRTAEVGRGVVQSTVSGNGSLEAAEQAELNFGASGEVTGIHVEAGVKVSKNEVLARVDSSSARASLASAEAQLSEAEEMLESAEEVEVSSTYDSGGTTVLASYEGEVATETAPQTTPGSTEETPAEEEEADEKAPDSSGKGSEKAKEKEAEEKPQETEPAPEQQAAPAATAPESSGGSVPSTGGGETSTPSVTVSVATAEANLRQAELSVESAEQEVSETTLRAPFAGTVASISGSVGETVSGAGSSGSSSPSGGSSEQSTGGLALGGGGSSTGSTQSTSSAFIVLTQLDRLKMEVSFSESDIGKVEVGQPATVSISSMEGTELAGRVTKVDVLPSESSSGGVVEYPATILLAQRVKGQRAGMSASAEVVVEQVSDAVTVPNEAIASGPNKTVTVEADGKEAQRTVETGLVGDEATEILSGLEPGETLVLPEASVPAGGMEGGGGGGLPDFGGGGVPSFGGGGPPSGFPGAP